MARGMPQEVLDHLAAVSLFSACSRAELRKIASLGTEVRIPPGTKLTEEDRPGSEFFLVVEGELRCEKGGSTVAHFSAGDYFGELALLTKRPRIATVVAETDVVVRVFDRREFSSLLDDSPAITRKILAAAAALATPDYRH